MKMHFITICAIQTKRSD